MSNNDDSTDKEVGDVLGRRVHRHRLQCPLCMEPFELDDINFYPCNCEYQICRFCWHRIRTEENGLCPACRQEFPEDPVNFKPLSKEELQRIHTEKRQKQQKEKQKVSENRKHLANLRVIQKNLVYVIGLSERIANVDVLKRAEYFGRYGKIQKIVVGTPSHIQQGAQQLSYAAYVTYVKWEDALRCIAAINNTAVDGRVLKASLGTTKYCSAFLRSAQCTKGECMYLHDVADSTASFTKEEMQQGKHADFERRLADQLIPATARQAVRNRSASPVAGQRHASENRDVTTNGDGPSTTHTRAQRLPPRHQRTKQSTATSVSSTRNGGSKGVSVQREKSASTERLNSHSSGVKTPNGRPASKSLRSKLTGSNHLLTEGGIDRIVEQFTLSDNSSDCDQDTTITSMWPPQAFDESPPLQQPPGLDTRLTTGTTVVASEYTSCVSIASRSVPEPTLHAVDHAHHHHTLLHEDALRTLVDEQATDWQAAFTSLPVHNRVTHQPQPPPAMAPTHRPPPAPILDDDDGLGFDPFSESAKGLQEMVEEERKEAEAARQQQQQRATQPNAGRYDWPTQYGAQSTMYGQPSMHNTPNQYQMQHINGLRGYSTDMKGVFVRGVIAHVRAGPPANNNGVAGYLNNRRHTSGNRGNSVAAQPMPPWQQSPVHASRSMSPPMLANSADSTHDLLSEWQQETRNELQSLLPNVSIRVATGPQAHYAPPRTSVPPPPTGWPPQQSRGLPFNQPPPMLHMGGMHHGSPMRPSPPMAAPDFAHPPPHLLDRAGLPPHLGMNLRAPPPIGPPPNLFGGNAQWHASVTPPPPGFSPGQKRL